jgi:hypothetical protein
MKDKNKEVIVIDDEKKGEVKINKKKGVFENFCNLYLLYDGDVKKVCETLGVNEKEIYKQIVQDVAKRRKFLQVKKVLLLKKTEELEKELLKTAKIREQLGMFFLKTAFPDIYQEQKARRPLTLKFVSKIRDKTIDIPNFDEE